MPWVEQIMFYVYFLSLVNGQIYTGSTKDLKIRYKEHAGGKVFYTKSHLPCELIGYESYVLETDARQREKYLKTTDGKKVFKKQYHGIIEKLERSHSPV